jgi:hypothetical protein
MQDVAKTDSQSDEPESGNKNPLRAAYVSFKALPITWRIVGAALLGVVVLATVARWLPDMKERMKFFTDTAFAWLVFVVVLVQSYIYRSQTEIMGNTLLISSQSYVCIRDIQVEQVRDRIFIEVENLGRVPANNVTVSFWLRLELPATFARKNPSFQKVYQYGEKSELFSGNLPIRIQIPHTEWLDGTEIGFIKAEVGTLIAEGLITFYDGFQPGKPKYTHFAFDYDMGEKKWYPRRILSLEETRKAIKEQTAKENPK